MRSDQKTYSSYLINDPDKNTSAHEILVQYLSTFEKSVKLLSTFLGDDKTGKINCEISKPLLKVVGHTQSVVGFVDIFYSISNSSAYLFVEVKSKREPVSNWIQQINMYRSYLMGTSTWVLACAERIYSNEVKLLENENINFIFICPKEAKKFVLENRTLCNEPSF